MIRSLASVSLMLSLHATAHAADQRLVTHRYDADEVVRIAGHADVQASIAFAVDEHIENVAIGDSASWQVTPNKRANLLFVKPITPRARTNMTVVTDQRTYFFDLVAGTAATPVYALRFTYPDALKPAPVQHAHGTPSLTREETQAVAGQPAERPVDPAELNFAWRSRGSTKLLPARIYDDGTSTFLAWSSSTPLPAILIRDEKGAEGPVNFAVRDDVIVVDGVHPLLVLRSGKDIATLENQKSRVRVTVSGSHPTAAASPKLVHGTER